MVKSSYRFDGLTLTVFPPEYDTENLGLVFELLNERGYEVREATKDDELRKAQGYNPNNAKMIKIEGRWFTLQTRMEWHKESKEPLALGSSALVVLSSNDLDVVNIRKLFRNLDGMCKATRFDVAVDLTYKTDFDLLQQAIEIDRLVGYSPDYANGIKQNPENAIRSGRNNPKRPIKTASKTISNGMTLYIGSRSSKFMVRMYDKSAEVKKKLDIDMEPTLRFELEVKQEHAEAVRRFVQDSTSKKEKVAKMVWQGLTDDSIMFEVNGKDETFSEVLALKKTREIQLDYSKVENAKMAYEVWVKKQIAPSFRRRYGELSREEKLEKLSELFLDE
ncbi:replication initiation factor domain-containing protein [Alkalibacterium kapii]|uniref:Replication initiation protein-like C-terminal domain-containing protein n=1 Tax=Alkalibacterium kapii TaxID=426704 RepID=A0A511B329_9LACT|nr:replication initiation factor domain-containing protein [Alkalibacterium kapii]GEK92217.1 hypothetical protein AKA01nite_18390 [Alkalibacterium kapii]